MTFANTSNILRESSVAQSVGIFEFQNLDYPVVVDSLYCTIEMFFKRLLPCTAISTHWMLRDRFFQCLLPMLRFGLERSCYLRFRKASPFDLILSTSATPISNRNQRQPFVLDKSGKTPLRPSPKAIHLPVTRAPLSASSFLQEDTGIEESYMNEHVKNQPSTMASVAGLNEIPSAGFESAERESIFGHQTNCEMPISPRANSSRRSLSREYCQESLLSRQMELVEMQMKVAGEQFLAAKQQRIYYELKTQQLQSRRMANADFTNWQGRALWYGISHTWQE